MNQGIHELRAKFASRQGIRVAARWIAMVAWCSGAFTIFSAPTPEQDELLRSIPGSFNFAAMQYGSLLDSVKDDTKIPRTFVEGKVKTVAPKDWTSGFFAGSLWYLYEFTRDPKWLAAATDYTERLDSIKNYRGGHDVGFILNCSYGNGWRLVTNSAYRAVLVQGAQSLATRFDTNVGLIRSWNHAGWTYPVIVDNLMNLELLLWAARESGDRHLREVAVSHADRTLKNHFRPDFSSFHVVDYNPANGAVLAKKTHQGAADNSAWARGQAWGLYGYTMMFRETANAAYLAQAKSIASFILNHPRLPADKIPYWDFDAPGIPDAPRDASAAAVMSSALIELSGIVGGEAGGKYLSLARQQLLSLSSPAYRAKPGENGNFILMHSTGSFPGKSEVDVPLNYADYYYLEALLRYRSRMNAAGAGAKSSAATELQEAAPNVKKPDVTPLSIPGSEPFVFRKAGTNELRLHVVKPEGWSKEDRRPGLVSFFGGGWNAGTPEISVQWAKWAASKGLVGIAPDYRTRNRFGGTPEDCVSDGRAALRWVEEHADELGIDPKKMIVEGSSAGGHVAAWTAIPSVGPGKDDPAPEILPAALVLLNPVTETEDGGYGGTKRFGNDDARARACSVPDQMPAKMPPTIVFHATADKTVPYTNSVAFRDQLVENGNRCELVTFEGLGHAYNSSKYGEAGKVADTKTRADVTTFLTSLGLMENKKARQSLDSGWEYYQGSLGSTWEIWRRDKASDNVTWTPVTLPHCFNARDAVDPDVRYYQGPGWYRTRLKLANPFPNGRTLLHFDGAGQQSQVFVGMKKVGEHLGGYDQWDVDITDAAAKEIEVPVAVLCDNSRNAESIPSDLSDFNRYGGIYRHVSLVYAPAISLERVHVEPKLGADGKASVKVRGRLYNPAGLKDEAELSIEVRDEKGKSVHTSTQKLSPWSGEKEIAGFEITAPKLWSPKSPTLYNCTVALKSAHGEQQLKEKFGVRSVEWVEHGPFKLNGERLLLRGTHYHEDHAGVAAAVPDAVVRQTLHQMKEMGANFVRLGHYQQAPLVLELCDELGLLVWEEIPWCRGGLGGDSYKQQCRDMLSHMIDQHYNHPAIILWGLGNENDWPGDFEKFDQEAIRTFMAELNTQAHQLDSMRQTSIRRCDFCKDIVDVYSPSIWAGWYGGRYTEYRASVEKAIADTPHFFHAEYGGDSHARRFSEAPEKFLAQVATGQGTAEVGKAYKASGGKARPSKDGDWSESYMVNLFDWHLHEQETMTNLTGAAQWIFKDFATPLRPENPVPRVNQKGVTERDGTLKESFYVFQSYWSEKPMVHIYGHTWPVRWGKAGEEKQVKVFSNCREVELFVNGLSAGVKQRNNADFPAAGLHWNVKLKEGANKLRAVGKTEGAEIVDEIFVAYQTASWGKPAKLTLNELSRKNDLVTIEARVSDQDGVPCLDAANLIRFGLTGDGKLLDNLGTSTGSRAVQLYNGRAQISLRLTGMDAVASVSTDGIKTAFLNVTNTK